MSVYFITQDLMIICKRRSEDPETTASVWYWFNLTKTLGPVLMISFGIGNAVDEYNEIPLQRNKIILLSVICLAMWYKILIIMRNWEYTAYLVRMIELCLYDIRVFGFLYICVLAAFANA